MKFLIYGAGVLGSLYAARLQASGHAVTLLARGQRLADLRQHGLVLEEASSGERQVFPVTVIERLDPREDYDYVLVVVRKNQAAGVIADLKINCRAENLVFIYNNAAGPYDLVEAFGPRRILLGFPGAGGERLEHVVRYQLASANVQPTTLGELDGSLSPRLERLAAAFIAAGLPAVVSRNMDAWLKTHVALVSPIANALYLAGGSNYRLADTRDGLVLMVRAVKEGLMVLQALEIPIEPAGYRNLLWLPEPLLVVVLSRTMRSARAELAMARHANAARDEMTQLADEFYELVHCSGLETPAIDALRFYLSPENPPAPVGASELDLDWRPIRRAAGILAGALAGGLAIAYLVGKLRGPGRGREEQVEKTERLGG